MLTAEYTVRLEQFEGPLDLLLHLIRNAELDITEISVAAITDQYLEHLRQIERVDVESAGEFLVIAATLLEVKSRLVSPAPQGDGEAGSGGADALARSADDESDNPAAELIRQLLAYKAYRDAADALEARRLAWSERHPLAEVSSQAEAFEAYLSTVNDLDLEDLQVQDLVEAFQRILESVSFDRLGSHSVTYDDTPIELHAADIMDRLARERAARGEAALTLRSVFSGRSRGEMIGLFLATLELVRQRRLKAVQDEQSGEVWLEACEEEPPPAPEPPADGPDDSR